MFDLPTLINTLSRSPWIPGPISCSTTNIIPLIEFLQQQHQKPHNNNNNNNNNSDNDV